MAALPLKKAIHVRSDYGAPLGEARACRQDKTYSNHVMLTDFGQEKIEAWAQANGLNFSAAIETLAHGAG